MNPETLTPSPPAASLCAFAPRPDSTHQEAGNLPETLWGSKPGRLRLLSQHLKTRTEIKIIKRKDEN